MSIMMVDPPIAGNDPYFPNVVALLHGQGTDETQVFTDVKGNTWTASAFDNLDTPNPPAQRVWTCFGNAQLTTAQAKFGNSCLVLDGTGDYVSLGDHVDFEPASGDFTIECWIRLNSLAPAGMAIMSKYVASGSQRSWILALSPSGNTLQWTTSATGGTPTTLSGAFTWALNTWYAIAVSRVGSTWRLFVNGNVVATGTATGLLSGSAPVYIGAQNSSGSPDNFFNGWIDELRFCKGVGKYSANYTPATDPFDIMTDADYKKIMGLLHFEGANASTTIRDSVHSPIIDTAQALYGSSSIAFPWGCSITSPDNTNFEYGSGAFTIEAAVRIRNFDGVLAQDIFTKYLANIGGDREYIFAITGNGGALQFAYDLNGAGIDETVNGPFAFAVDTWYQVAVSRVGGTIYLFVDGNLVGQSSTIGGSAIRAALAPVRIGQQNSGSAGNSGCLYGWVQEVRVTKGVGRYTSNYTPPSAPFPDY